MTGREANHPNKANRKSVFENKPILGHTLATDMSTIFVFSSSTLVVSKPMDNLSWPMQPGLEPNLMRCDCTINCGLAQKGIWIWKETNYHQEAGRRMFNLLNI